MRRRLIVNADDYGLSEGVSRGIREAHLRGIVRSTSVMMNMPGVENELRAAMEETPRLGLGVHLNLTAGHPLLRAGQIPSLVGEDGILHRYVRIINHLESIELEEVRQEWEAQVGYFIRITSKMPTHLDSHHHCSYLSPDLFRMMLKLAEKYECGIRNIHREDPVNLPDEFPASKQDEIKQGSRSIIKEFHIPQPDHFYSSFFGESATFERMKSILGTLPEGVSEVMCHPGYLDEYLARKSSYAREREGELEILTNPEIIALVRNESIELVSFADIKQVNVLK